MLDSLIVNLRMEGVLVREELSFKWHSEGGLVENIEMTVQVNPPPLFVFHSKKNWEI